MNATDYEQLTKNVLEGVVSNNIEAGINSICIYELDGLNDISIQLHNRDGWCDWHEIKQAVYAAAVACCKRRRLPIWQSVRAVLDEWKSGN